MILIENEKRREDEIYSSDFSLLVGVIAGDVAGGFDLSHSATTTTQMTAIGMRYHAQNQSS